MITNKDIVEAEGHENLPGEEYLKGIVDFVKWSSALAVAAILWIGNFITSAKGSWTISAFSLLLLTSSLVVAVLAARRVLTAWVREWDVAREDHAFPLFKKWKAIRTEALKPAGTSQRDELDKQDRERTERLIKATCAVRPFSESKGSNSWIS